MYYRLITLSIMILMFVAAYSPVNAQQQPPQQQPPVQQQAPDIDVSDKELEKFVNAVEEVQKLQKSSQEKMVNAIEDEGLDANRFVQINNLQMNQQVDSSDKVSEKEMKSYNKAKKKVDKMQKEMQDKQVKAIESQGIDVERYVEIARAAQADPELRQKIQKMQSN